MTDIRKRIDKIEEIPLKPDGKTIDLDKMRRVSWKNQQFIMNELDYQSRSDRNQVKRADDLDKKSNLGVIAFVVCIFLCGLAATEVYGITWGAAASGGVFILKYIVGGIRDFLS